MNSLFNKYEAMNEDGKNLADEIGFAIHPIIVKYWKQGFSLSEILSIIVLAVTVIISELVITGAADKRKKERMQK